MSRIRRNSRHSRKKGRGNTLYIFALLLLAMLTVWLLTADFESSTAFRWMTGTEDSNKNKNVEVKVFDGGQFGVALNDSIPRWIASSPHTLTEGDSVIFSSSQFGKHYELKVGEQQQSLWDDYVRHLHHWQSYCDTMYLIYGQVPDSNALYSINLCISEESKGQAIIIPDNISALPFFNFTHPIDDVERLTKIDFFADLLDEESEAYIEKFHQRLQWLYPAEFYNTRIEQNKTIQHGNN